MSRRLSALLLLFAILSASAGMLLFATLRLHWHHHRMGRSGPAGAVVLEVGTARLSEVLRGVREIRLDGRWFDIEHVDNKAGKWYMTGHYDDEEEDLLQRIRRFSEEIGRNGKERVPVVLPPLYFEPIEAPDWNGEWVLDLAFADPDEGLSVLPLPPLVPPPVIV